MMYPDTLQMSSHSASKSVHQQCGGLEGSAISQWRVVSSIAALIMVGTAYNAYTGVWSLGGCSTQNGQDEKNRHERVVKISPCSFANAVVSGQTE